MGFDTQSIKLQKIKPVISKYIEPLFSSQPKINNGFDNLQYRNLNDFWTDSRDQLILKLNRVYKKIFSNLGSLDFVMVNVYRDGEVTFKLV